ncbi:MAG: hypothetical protein ACHQYP_09935 [Nitrospiria bacterium]
MSHRLSDNTLLSEFIKKKERQYIPPERKGTPKGEPIGLSEKKYKVSLRFLYQNKLKDLATEFNVSYGVLRRWAIEESFTHTVQEIKEEYSEYFWSAMKKNKESWYQETPELYSLSPRRGILLIPSPQKDITLFADYAKYDTLLRAIIETKIIKQLNQPEMSCYVLVVLSFFKTLNPEKQNAEIRFDRIIGELRKIAGGLIAKELRNIGTTATNQNDRDDIKYLSHAAKVLEDWIVHKSFSEWKREQLSL